MTKNPIDTNPWLDKCYGKSVPAYAAVKYWASPEIRLNCTRTNNTTRSGRPHQTVTKENIAKIRVNSLGVGKINLNEFVNISTVEKYCLR